MPDTLCLGAGIWIPYSGQTALSSCVRAQQCPAWRGWCRTTLCAGANQLLRGFHPGQFNSQICERRQKSRQRAIANMRIGHLSPFALWRFVFIRSRHQSFPVFPDISAISRPRAYADRKFLQSGQSPIVFPGRFWNGTPGNPRGRKEGGLPPGQATQSHPKPPQSHIKATQSHTKAIPKPTDSQPKATTKPPQSHTKAISKLPQSNL